MISKYENVKPIIDFDWEGYESSFRTRLIRNKKVNVRKDSKDKVYECGLDAQSKYDSYQFNNEIVSKELVKNSIVKITDFVMSNSKNEIIATVNNGANSIAIDLNKENKWFETIDLGGVPMTKETFIECLEIPEHKQTLLNLNLSAKVNGHGDKASIWDGYVENLVNEMKEQVIKGDKAYYATVESSNAGGYFVNIGDGIQKAYMPRSMSAANRVIDFEELIGKRMEVMIESYDPHTGFIVSRKKFIRKITPVKLQALSKELEKNPNTQFTGTVTGTTAFGIFIEIDEFITGMLHKTLISDELNKRFKNREIKAGEQINVYVHKIENGRVIFSDIPLENREEIISKREKEDEAEKLKIAKANANFSNIKKENKENE